MSLEELAVAVGARVPELIAYEHGRRSPRPRRLCDIARVLQVAPHELTTVTAAEATLEDLRAWCGRTREALAGELGLPRTTYTSWEATGRTPSNLVEEELVARVAAVLGLSIEAIQAAKEQTAHAAATRV